MKLTVNIQLDPSWVNFQMVDKLEGFAIVKHTLSKSITLNLNQSTSELCVIVDYMKAREKTQELREKLKKGEIWQKFTFADQNTNYISENFPDIKMPFSLILDSELDSEKDKKQ